MAGELALSWLAVALVGAAVKVTDATVDGEPGVQPAAAASWALLLVALAAALRPALAASLAAGAWLVGMLQPGACDGPGGRARRVETALVACLCLAALGPAELAASAAALGAVQLLDDWLDGDGPTARWRTGIRAAGFVALMGVGLWLDPLRLALVLSATPVAEQAGGWLARRSGLLQGGGDKRRCGGRPGGAGQSGGPADSLHWAG